MVDWSIGYGATALDFNQLARFLGGNYVESGCTPSAGANAMEVDVASGTVRVGGSNVSVSAQTVTLSSSNSDPRKDVVYIDGTGSAATLTGNAVPAEPSGETQFDTYNPAPPDMVGTTGVPVAEVWVGGGVSDIASGDIRDRTEPLDLSYNHLADTHNRPTAGNQLSDNSNTFAVQENAGSGLQADQHIQPNLHIPVSEIPAGDYAATHLYTASGETLNVYSWGVRTRSGTTPSGLTVELYDVGSASSVSSASTARQTGNPITSSSSADLQLRVDNATGDTVYASGFFGYSIE